MKKLTICLLAVSIMLGFASCQKDAETNNNPANNSGNNSGPKEWVSETVWVHVKESKYSWSEQKDEGWTQMPVYVCDKAGITELEKFENFNFTNGEFVLDNEKEHITLQEGIGNILDSDEKIGILDEKVVISKNFPASLDMPEANSTKGKVVYTFNDTNKTTLTIYKIDPQSLMP